MCWINEFSLLRPDLQTSIGAEVQEHVETTVEGIGLKKGVDNHQNNDKGGGRDMSL